MKSSVIKANLKKLIILLAVILLSVAIVIGTCYFIRDYRGRKIEEERLEKLSSAEVPEFVTVDLIDIHDYARTGNKIDGFRNIVVHYVGNPGTTAKNNRDYFNNPGTNVSSHFVVGLEGEIIQCLPLYEISAASNHRNHDTISIEVCHQDTGGKFSDKTYDSLIKLLSWLCCDFNLKSQSIIRHYDITGKECPLYYVKNQSAWDELIEDVESANEKNSNQ